MLAVASDHAEQARVVMREYHDQGLTAAERAQGDIVVDFESEEMTCPACLTIFATGPTHCPDCGLFLGNG